MASRLPRLLIVVLIALGVSVVARGNGDRNAAGSPALTSYVDPSIGTGGQGYTFPGAARPFGMVQWSPDSSAGGLLKPGGYNHGDPIITGFSLTHLSGAGCAAFGNVPIMPTARPVRSPRQPNGSPYSDRFVLGSERAEPGTYAVTLKSEIQVTLAAGDRSGLGLFRYPHERMGTVLFETGDAAGPTGNLNGAFGASTHIVNRTTVVGWAQSGGFCRLHNRFTVYFAAQFNRPFERWGTWRPAGVRPGSTWSGGPHSGAYVTFNTTNAPAVLVRVAISYTGITGALQNLRAEGTGWSIERAEGGARAAWEKYLDLVRILGGTHAQRVTFYTALYHSLLAPNLFSDADGRYVGFDGRVRQLQGREQYANFSGWDIYRTQIPLLALLAPDRMSDMVASLIADAQQGGALPKWPVANDYTGEMDGDSADAIIADAYAFGARRFDARAALTLMVRGANGGVGRHSYVERPGVQSYLQQGYVSPQTGGWGPAAETLEYATDDWSISRLAAALGESAIARDFARRSLGWRHLFDAGVGYVRPRTSSGAFLTPFSPAGTDGFVEGNAAQYTWMVPHDLPWLIRALGGPGRTVRRLDTFFDAVDAGPQSPHYWGGNEPDLHVPWIYDASGQPWKTDQVVQRIMGTLYAPRPAGIPGNDDLGTLSAWYVWAALGLYPEIPGVGGFALNSPTFPAVTLNLPQRGIVRITGSTRPHDEYIQQVSVGGQDCRSAWLRANSLRSGAVITVTLGPKPSARWASRPWTSSPPNSC